MSIRKLKVNVGRSKVKRYTRIDTRGELHVSLGGEMLEEVERNGHIKEEVKFRLGEAGKFMEYMKRLR